MPRIKQKVLFSLLFFLMSRRPAPYLEEGLAEALKDAGTDHDVGVGVAVGHPPPQHFHSVCWVLLLVLGRSEEQSMKNKDEYESRLGNGHSLGTLVF